MPVAYAIIDDSILIVLTGKLQPRELLEAQHELFADPAFVKACRWPRLVDATGVTDATDVSDGVVRHLAACAHERGLRRAALVSNNQELVHRMMTLYAEHTGDAKVEVFRNREAATRWLRGIYVF